MQLADIRHKLERLEERFILEELTTELYHKYKGKFEQEMEHMEAQRANNKMWASGDYTQRQELQNALFEGGIVYDRHKDECRSIGENEFVTEIAQLSGSFDNFTSDNKKNFDQSSVRTFRAESRNLFFEMH